MLKWLPFYLDFWLAVVPAIPIMSYVLITLHAYIFPAPVAYWVPVESIPAMWSWSSSDRWCCPLSFGQPRAASICPQHSRSVTSCSKFMMPRNVDCLSFIKHNSRHYVGDIVAFLFSTHFYWRKDRLVNNNLQPMIKAKRNVCYGNTERRLFHSALEYSENSF